MQIADRVSRRLSMLALVLLTGAGVAWNASAQQGNGHAEPTTGEPSRAGAGGTALLAAFAELSPEERTYLHHNATLSNPFFEGRAPGSRGNELAAEYCAFYFRTLGLEPIFSPRTEPVAENAGDEQAAGSAKSAESGTVPATVVVAPSPSPAGAALAFEQPFPAGSRLVLTDQILQATVGSGEPMTMALGTDFVVTPQSTDGEATGEAVFVGYSIERGPDDYSTYLLPDGKDTDEADLNGKIALVLRLEPKNEHGKSKWAGGEGAAGGGRGEGGGDGPAWSDNARLAGKLRRAVQRGAAGIVVISPPGADDPRLERLDDLRTAARSMGRVQEVPVVQMSIAAAAKMLATAGADLESLTRAADERGSISHLPNLKLHLRVGTRQERTMSNNVGGLLRGRGALADQYVVIGAHFDHVGYGAFGSRDAQGQGKLHPGADDNASGTAGMLLAAEILSRQYEQLPESASVRSIIFVAFSAEEGGLIGSRFFARNSPVPTSSIYAMLNMDMIGRLRDDLGLEVSGVATAEGFKNLIQPILDSFSTKVGTLPGGAGPSDHASFYAAGVPVLAFFTGFHADYHMPSDQFHTINTPGAVRVVRLVTALATMLAGRHEPLTFTRARGPSSARDLGGDNPTGQTRTTFRVQFGIRPGTYEDDKPGVPVGDVTEGTSAAEAGIKTGDRLVRWNGEDIEDIRGWMRMLRAAAPGDIVHVVVIRNGEELTIPVTMRARDNPGER
ncbi:MAG: M28 family peptidase [Phycisphaerales bacterium]